METNCILAVNLFVNSLLFTFGLCYPYCYLLLYQTWKLRKKLNIFRCSRALSCFLSWNGRGIVWRLWLWRVRNSNRTPLYSPRPMVPTQTCRESPSPDVWKWFIWDNLAFDQVNHNLYNVHIIYIDTWFEKKIFSFLKKRKITKSIRLLIIGTFHFFRFRDKVRKLGRKSYKTKVERVFPMIDVSILPMQNSDQMAIGKANDVPHTPV